MAHAFAPEYSAIDKAKPILWEHAMLDIETCSTHTSNALILSCAILPFSHDDMAADDQRFFVTPDIAQQLFAGREVTKKTMDWWREQPPEASEHWRDSSAARTPFASGFAERIIKWWERTMLPEGVLWANGIVFDVGNVENYLRNIGYASPPWSYRAVRDYRTVINGVPESALLRPTDQDVVDLSGSVTAHDPMFDCVKQAMILQPFLDPKTGLRLTKV